MNGINILTDTNPLIYLLDGSQVLSDSAANFLDGKHVWMSIITELELFGKKGLKKQEIKAINKLIKSCFVIEINEDIKESTKELMQNFSIKLPDAVIASTAIYLDFPLFTSDKVFAKIPELNVVLLED